MRVSSLPILLFILVGTVIASTTRATRRGAITPTRAMGVYGWLAGVVAWAGISSWLAITGRYLTPGFLRTLPGLWVPLVPYLMAQPLVVTKQGRAALWAIMDHVSPTAVVWISMLRIAGIGTAYKTWQGTFPAYFEYAVGVPDLLFALSATLVLSRVRRGAITWRGLSLWHLLGFLVVGPPVLLLIQAGLPGPLERFTVPPTAEVLFQFPMVLAPSVLIPIFGLLNQLAAAWLFVRRPELTRRHEAVTDIGKQARPGRMRV